MGMLLALLAVWVGTPSARSWPSDEMVSRGNTHALASGFLVAMASGVATALSTLGRNSSGLVGVAISLSLLPPMVNAGLCLCYAALITAPGINRVPGDTTDYVVVGWLSFALTCMNIGCIFVAGVFTFWVCTAS